VSKPMRAIALAGLLVAALGVPASAQDVTWPSVDEMRWELQQIGFVFGFNGSAWEGGRDMSDPIYSLPSVELRHGAGGLSATVMSVSDKLGFDRGWPDSYRTSATALMEVLSRLPDTEATIPGIVSVVKTGGKGCESLLIPGGSLTIDGTDWTKKLPLFDITMTEGGTGDC
jgi:hypothetical protein